MSNYIGYIYSITNKVNGKTYIGKTNDLVRRWKEHYYGKGGAIILKNALKKYGVENFLFDVIAKIPFDTKEELNDVLKQLEIYYISLYDTFHNGYNATTGGDGISYYEHSEETKQKLRERQIEKWKDEEFRAKCATAALGYHHTEDAKNRITQALLHRDHSVYERAAEKRRGVKRDPNVIMKGAIKRRKPILQYDLEGNFIKEWEGASCVEGFERSNIGMCCKGKLVSSQGYIWRFKDSDDFPKKIEVPDKWTDRKNPVLQFNQDGELLAEYESALEASRCTGICSSAIYKCLYKQQKQVQGFIWEYKERKEVNYA